MKWCIQSLPIPSPVLSSLTVAPPTPLTINPISILFLGQCSPHCQLAAPTFVGHFHFGTSFPPFLFPAPGSLPKFRYFFSDTPCQTTLMKMPTLLSPSMQLQELKSIFFTCLLSHYLSSPLEYKLH